VTESPIEKLLRAFDSADLDAVIALFSPEARLLIADGQRAEGRAAVRALLGGFLATVHASSHQITAQWHQDNVWIAEVEANYELQDRLQLNGVPRAFVLYEGPDGIADLRAYGAREHPLAEHRTGEEGMWIRERWIPPL
jgi:SnoaL-like domain